MDTFPITFPVPSPATAALTSKREFTFAWRKEAEVNFNGFTVRPSLSLCQLYFDLIRGGMILKPFAVLDTESARKDCAINPKGDPDPSTHLTRLQAAGLR